MPGVGVTDPAAIFALVSAQRRSVATSVIVQLVSAVLYIPALVGLVADPQLGPQRGVRAAAGLMSAGAMGSVADAVLHLLAFAMTAHGVDSHAMIPVMGFMQGSGLLLVSPLILAFFVGGGWLSYALARTGSVPRAVGHLHWAAPLVAAIGGALATNGLVSARAIGLLALGCVAAAQIWTGVALSARTAPRRQPATAS
jgi:hypothetical protein